MRPNPTRRKVLSKGFCAYDNPKQCWGSTGRGEKKGTASAETLFRESQMRAPKKENECGSESRGGTTEGETKGEQEKRKSG